jgi:hypothetical protein
VLAALAAASPFSVAREHTFASLSRPRVLALLAIEQFLTLLARHDDEPGIL